MVKVEPYLLLDLAILIISYIVCQFIANFFDDDNKAAGYTCAISAVIFALSLITIPILFVIGAFI